MRDSTSDTPYRRFRHRITVYSSSMQPGPDDLSAATPDGPPSSRDAAKGPVWTRPVAPGQSRPTRSDVLAAALRLADAEGLEAVSVRRIAGDLAVRPMSLYSFFSRKDDLIDLMVDEVIGEMHVADLPEDWRDALRAIARRTREVGSRHPWLMTALTQHPPIGPHAVRHLEQSLAAISRLGLDDDSARALLQAVDVYVIGSGTVALAERQMRQRDDLPEQQWQDSTKAYFDRLTASGEFPHLARMRSAALLSRPSEDAFEQGLEWLLNGFAATVLTSSAQPDPRER
jgi:AcrR family transcriptional regulator